MRLYQATELGLNLFTMTKRGAVPVYRKESKKGLHGGLFIKKFDDEGNYKAVALRNGASLYDEQANRSTYYRHRWEGDGEFTASPFNLKKLVGGWRP